MSREFLTSSQKRPDVFVSLIQGTAEDGWWMAYSFHGMPLCSRKSKREALRVGRKIFDEYRFKFNGRIG